MNFILIISSLIIISIDILMPIIKAGKIKDIKKIKILIDNILLENIDSYMKWAGTDDYSSFFSQAAEFVLKKDKEWRRDKNIKK